jgi:hypothetical protein
MSVASAACLLPAHYHAEAEVPVLRDSRRRRRARPVSRDRRRFHPDEKSAVDFLPGESATYRSRARVVESFPTTPLGSGRVPGMGCAFVEPPPELVDAIHNLTQF